MQGIISLQTIILFNILVCGVSSERGQGTVQGSCSDADTTCQYDGTCKGKYYHKQ